MEQDHRTKATFATAATTTLALDRVAHAAGTDSLKIALVGCGGRGAGAANQALTADTSAKLVAMVDVFPDRLATGLNSLKTQKPGQVDVPPERQFIGFDGYREAIALADVVILATPCAFRPLHFEEAVRRGKHVFLEKPVAVDAPGVRRVLAAAAEAKRKNLKIAVGFQRRHHRGYRDLVQRIHDGAIGGIHTTRAYANTPTRAGLPRKPDETELQYQLRNWYYFGWLSGDFIVDNLIHGMDISNWIKGAYPVRAQGMGGRQVMKEHYGNLFDHFAVEYEYADGARLFAQCHRIVGCWVSVTEHAAGTTGTADFIQGRRMFHVKGTHPWDLRMDPGHNPYQQEHDDWFAAIRNDLPYNEADYGAKSTLTSIMGRMAAYSGKVVEWEDALNSNLSLVPEPLTWDTPAPVQADEQGNYALPVPGVTVAL
jgi:myo-inositol 2-dehydrogenase / D-chiro-inositol 1-dehydrogenase